MGELIPRKTVFDTLAHYMVVFRQRSLLAHRTIAQRLVTLNLIDEANSHAVSEVIDKEIRSLLNELGHLPEKATDPNWVRTFEREELGLKSNERERRQHRATTRRSKRASRSGGRKKLRRCASCASRVSSPVRFEVRNILPVGSG